MSTHPPLPDAVLLPFVQNALHEDLGQAGDITSNATIAADKVAKANIVLRGPGRIAGVDCARLTFAQLDPELHFLPCLSDGDDGQSGDVVANLKGPARAILASERTALNFLSHLSGIATSTREYVACLEGTKARLACTRKTLPGLRVLQKYAVRIGGGFNHRFHLGDAILIKDNHIHAAGSIAQALKDARQHAGHMVKIEIEVDTLAQLREAMDYRPDAVLLDNMDAQMLSQAVSLINGRALAEASGGVDLSSITAIANTGVDIISTSAITMRAPALDFGLDFID